jgi:hypothetical protein
MYLKHNIAVCSFNHYFSGKARSIAYYECVFIALVMQHAMHMRHIFICCLPGSKIFFHITHKLYDIREKVSDNKMCVVIFSATFV